MGLETIPKHLLPKRNPDIYPQGRECSVCAAILNRSNLSDRCAPCQLAAMPECEVLDLHPQDAA